MEAAIKASLSERAKQVWAEVRNTSTGSLVEQPPKVNQGAVATYRQYFDKRVTDLASRLANGDITVNQWQRSMGEEIERLHLTAWAIGRGGVNGMSQRDLRDVQRKIGEQKGYLDAWAGQLRQQRNRSEAFSEAWIASRGRLYGGAANATIWQANTAAIGIPRLPQYPGDGKTRCRTNCKCSQKIVKLRGDGNFNVFWKLGTAEHCPNCQALARQWNPLKIRGGKIV